MSNAYCVPETLQWYAKGGAGGVASSGTATEGALSVENFKKQSSLVCFLLSPYYYRQQF